MTVKRITFVQELLAFIGLEGRLHLEWISSAEAQKFVRVVTDFTETIRALGPNPIPDLCAAPRAFDLKAVNSSGRPIRPMSAHGTQ